MKLRDWLFPKLRDCAERLRPPKVELLSRVLVAVRLVVPLRVVLGLLVLGRFTSFQSPPLRFCQPSSPLR